MNLLLLDIVAKTGRRMFVIDGAPVETIDANVAREKLKTLQM